MTFWKSSEMLKLVKDVVNTAYEFPFKGLRIFKADAISIAVDQQYSQNALLGIVNVEDWTTVTCVAMDRRGKRTTVPNVKRLDRGVVIEAPITMILSCLLQREQLIQTQQREQLTEHQKSSLNSNLQRINDQIDQLTGDAPSIMCMGEQAIAVDNGSIYFHQPVATNWLSFVETVDYTAVPTFMQGHVNDYRARSVDTFKGVTGSAGTLEEIESQLDDLGVGSHLKSTPWVKLPDKPAFDFEISEGMRAFLKENARYALGLFGNYLRTSIGNVSVDNRDVAKAMSDMALKLKRLGAELDFEIDSQDYSAIEVARRAFKHALLPLAKESRDKTVSQAAALVDLRYGRVNFDVDLPDNMSRKDITFYKKTISAMRRNFYTWPEYMRQAVTLNDSGIEPIAEIKLPSGSKAKVRIMDSAFYGFYDDEALFAICEPENTIVNEMVDFIEQIEGIMLYLDSPTVKLDDIVPDLEGDIVRVGGLYRKLADVMHPSITSPNFVLMVPVGKVNYA